MMDPSAGESGGPAVQKLSAVVSELELLMLQASAGPSAPADPLFCFDLLHGLLRSIEHEPDESLQLMQRRTEDVLQGLLLLSPGGPPVRRLIAQALVRVIEKGDSISVYSRVSTLQSWFSEKGEKRMGSYLGALEGLGAITGSFGSRIASSLAETVSVVQRLMRNNEVTVRQAAVHLLLRSVEAMQGAGSAQAYSDAVKVLTGYATRDKAPTVRQTAAHCVRALCSMGGPGLAGGGLDTVAALCVKGLEDTSQATRDAFATALGSIIALGLNPQKQVLPRGRGAPPAAKAMDQGIQKYLITPFVRASAYRSKETRIGIAVAWTAFLQAMRQQYGLSDMDLHNYGLQAITMLPANSRTIDTQAQACVLYLLHVGVMEQMGEEAQRSLADALAKQLTSQDMSAHMMVASLRTLSNLLATLGEVTQEARTALDYGLLASLSNPSPAVRVQAALTIRALAEVDAGRVHSFILSGFTALRALRETLPTEKGERVKLTLDALHGQSLMLAALLVLGPRLPLGLPSCLSLSILEMAEQMVLTPGVGGAGGVGAGSYGWLNVAALEHEAGWILIGGLVLSMPKEEVLEREVEFLALWTIPFGGNTAEKVKHISSSSLPSELSCLSAAADALKAFVQSHVVPTLAATPPRLLAQRKESLLNPVLAYLQGALGYMGSPVLADASAAVRAHAELFAIKVLSTFLAFPDPELYRVHFASLVDICSSPFRESASNYVASSLLRQLLDSADSSLGPWVPGRDNLEDELRVVESGCEGVLRVVWDEYEAAAPSFPQSKALETTLVDTMLTLFSVVFTAQSLHARCTLVETLVTQVKASKSKSWRNAVTTNACVAVLGSLKAAVSKKSKEEDLELWRRVQGLVQSILAVDSSNPAFSRTCAEALGYLARLGDDVAAARLLRSLVSECESSKDPPQKAAIALSFGCILRSVGGIALSSLVPLVVQQLAAMARAPTPDSPSHLWALHSLWLTADAAGLSYTPHVKATLSLLMDVLLSDEHAAPGIFQSVGRVVNALVAVFGPEFMPGTTVYYRCKCIVDDISSNSTEPAAQLECVLFTQQLVLFAPNAVPLHQHVATLRATLASRQPNLRLAAVSTLRHMSEREPAAMVEQRIEEDLFAMLDNETDPRIVKLVCMTLERLLDAACPFCPSRWLRLCKNVVLAASATKRAGEEKAQEGGGRGQDAADDDESMVAADGGSNGTGPGSADAASAGEGSKGGVLARPGSGAGAAPGAPGLPGTGAVEQLPRFRTRLFAAQCLSRLPQATGSNPAHFDLPLARRQKAQEPDSDWLVLHLGDLIALSYQVGTGQVESVRPVGVALLSTILDKFGEAPDPDFEGHILLEQYQAQVLSTVRTTLDSVSNPLLMISGVQLADKVASGGLGAADSSLVHRVLGLLAAPLLKWEFLPSNAYADWVGIKVKMELLVRQARLKITLLGPAAEGWHAEGASPQKGAGQKGQQGEAYASSPPCLTKHWIGLLRDYVAISTMPSFQIQSEQQRQLLYQRQQLQQQQEEQPVYQPALSTDLSVSTLEFAKPLLAASWPLVLQAATIGVQPLPGGASREELAEMTGERSKRSRVDSHDFLLLWAAGMHALTSSAPEDGEGAGELPPSVGPDGPWGAPRNSRGSEGSRQSQAPGSRRPSGGASAGGGGAPMGGTSAALLQVVLQQQEQQEESLWGREVGTPERQRVALEALTRLCAREFFAPAFNTQDICCELLRALTSIVGAAPPKLMHAALDATQQIAQNAPEDVLASALLASHLAAVPLVVLHASLDGASTHPEQAWAQLVARALQVLELVPANMPQQAQAGVIPVLLCASLAVIGDVEKNASGSAALDAVSAEALAGASRCAVSLCSIGSQADSALQGGRMPDMAGWAGQRSSVVASAVETLTELVERVSGWAQFQSSHEGDSAAPAASVGGGDGFPEGLGNGHGEPNAGDGEEASGAGGGAPGVEGREAGAEEGLEKEDELEDGDFGDFEGPPPPAAEPPAQTSGEASAAGAKGGAGGDAGLAAAWSAASQGWSGSTALLGTAMATLAEIAPLVASPGGDYFGVQLSESASARCLHAFHILLASASPKLQAAAVGALRTLLRSAKAAGGKTANASGDGDARRAWALQCTAACLPDLCRLTYGFSKSEDQERGERSSTAMESLKLLLLLHSVLEDPQQQQALLDILLPSALAAASTGNASQGTPQASDAALVALLVGLVTHLASAFPQQLQAATGALPPDSKAQLQAVIRSAMAPAVASQQQQIAAARAARGSTSPPFQPGPARLASGGAPAGAPTGLTLAPPSLPLPKPGLSASLPLPLPKPAVIPAPAPATPGDPPPTSGAAAEEDDDEWAAFESHRSSASSGAPSVPSAHPGEAAGGTPEAPEARPSGACAAASGAGVPSESGSVRPSSDWDEGTGEGDDSDWGAFDSGNAAAVSAATSSSLASAGGSVTVETRVEETGGEDDEWGDFDAGASEGFSAPAEEPHGAASAGSEAWSRQAEAGAPAPAETTPREPAEAVAEPGTASVEDDDGWDDFQDHRGSAATESSRPSEEAQGPEAHRGAAEGAPEPEGAVHKASAAEEVHGAAHVPEEAAQESSSMETAQESSRVEEAQEPSSVKAAQEPPPVVAALKGPPMELPDFISAAPTPLHPNLDLGVADRTPDVGASEPSEAAPLESETGPGEPSSGPTLAPPVGDDGDTLGAPSAPEASSDASAQERGVEATLAEIASDEFGDFSEAETAQVSGGPQGEPGASPVGTQEVSSQVLQTDSNESGDFSEVTRVQASVEAEAEAEEAPGTALEPEASVGELDSALEGQEAPEEQVHRDSEPVEAASLVPQPEHGSSPLESAGQGDKAAPEVAGPGTEEKGEEAASPAKAALAAHDEGRGDGDSFQESAPSSAP